MRCKIFLAAIAIGLTINEVLQLENYKILHEINTMNHKQLIEHFYTSFQNGDADGMSSCYHPEVIFSDPAFGELHGDSVSDMWRMLIERSSGNLTITFHDVKTEDSYGSAKWEAKYPFSKSQRPVHNKIEAQFKFKDGKIIEHRDYFDFWKWSSMALGWPGKLLGFTPFLRNKVRTQSRELLKKYQATKPG